MKILILEDNPDRISRLKVVFPDAKYTETAKECIDSMQQGLFDLIALDHDLNNEAFVDSNRIDCGMEVVRFMLNSNNIGTPDILLHSGNELASKEMQKQLRDKGFSVIRFPFDGHYTPR